MNRHNNTLAIPKNIDLGSKKVNPIYVMFFVLSQLFLILSITQGHYLFPVIIIICLVTIFIVNHTEKSLYLILFSLAFSQSIPLFMVGSRVVGISSDFILLPILILSWLLRKLYQKNTDEIWRKNELTKPILVFLAFIAISLVFASTRLPLPQLMDGTLWAVGLAEYIFLAFIVTDLVKTEKQLKNLLFFMLALGAIIALVGILQGVVYGTNRVGSIFGSIFRGQSGNPNSLGAYMGLLAILSFSLANYYLRHHKFIFLFSFFLFIWTMILTLSRSSWLGLVLALAFLLFQLKRGIFLFGVVGFSILVFVMAPAKVGERAASIIQAAFDKRMVESFMRMDYRLLDYRLPKPMIIIAEHYDVNAISAGLRYAAWKETIMTFKKFPITGTGYFLNKYFCGANTAENLFLEILVGIGAFGFLAFMWLCLRIVKMAKNTYDMLPVGLHKTLTLGYRSGLVLILVMSLTGSLMLTFRLSGLFWFLTGLVLSIRKNMAY